MTLPTKFTAPAHVAVIECGLPLAVNAAVVNLYVALLEVVDLLLQGPEAFFILPNQQAEGGLRSRRDLLPKVRRNRRLGGHAADLRTGTAGGKFSP